MIVGYWDKPKGARLLEAFCHGAGGRLAREVPATLPPDVEPIFYGVTETTRHLWQQAKDEGRNWHYADNAYLDPCREQYFRVTHNRLQHSGVGPSDGARWREVSERFGIQIKPRRAEGRHVLLCPQSDQFMRTVVGYEGSWLDDTLEELRKYTDRELRVRPWNGDKRAWYRTLPDDLVGCHALVTYSSASAITALLAGVPALVTAEDCISRPVADSALEHIDMPFAPHEFLELWLRVVADNQWTIDEMASGLAWRALNG